MMVFVAPGPKNPRFLTILPVDEFCPMWKKWSQLITGSESATDGYDYMAHVFFTVLLATASSLLTMTTRTELPGALQINNVDEDLSQIGETGRRASASEKTLSAPVSYYSAAGSGVAEVKVILSGFVLHVRVLCPTSCPILTVVKGLSRIENSCCQNVRPDSEC